MVSMSLPPPSPPSFFFLSFSGGLMLVFFFFFFLIFPQHERVGVGWGKVGQRVGHLSFTAQLICELNFKASSAQPLLGA